MPNSTTPAVPWPAELNVDLAIAGEALSDIERLRIASENRLRQFIRPEGEPDKDGKNRGFGWNGDAPAVHAQALLVANMLCSSTVAADLGLEKLPKKRECCLEHDAERNLTRALRAHPLGPWVRSGEQKGIGEKQGGRLVAVVGDPYMRPDLVLADGTLDPARPRTISELRSYCGYGEDKANPGQIQKRRKGQHANWSAAAKMRAHLVAQKCVVTGFDKRFGCERLEGDDFATHTPECQCSRYRLVYDSERIKYADAVHDKECPQCAPAGSPAQPGTPLSLGHRKGRAVRRVAKEIIEDLWREAEGIHSGAPGGHVADELIAA